MFVGARDLDPPEVDPLATAGIRRATVEDLATVEELTAGLLPPGPLLLHVDVDVADPAELPPLRYPAPDGPSVTTVIGAVRRILDTGRVAGYDLRCTWLPDEELPSSTRALLLSTIVDGT